MILLYHLFRFLFLAGVRLVALQNPKARQWVSGRQNWKEALIAQWQKASGQKVVWMHCASLGEFEQGRPILEAILKKNNIPVVLASGLFRKSQPFFQWWGSFHRKMLQSFSFFFLQDDNSLQLLQKIGLGTNAVVSGDTRFDRVNEIAQNNAPINFAENFCTEKTLIAGSTWPEDEALLKVWHLLQPDWKLIVVPHEISIAHNNYLKKLFPGAVCLSELKMEDTDIDNRVMIVDQMGILSRLYQYATLCYIGGGLKKSGHHNILEAAVFGKAVVTGPHIKKFSESVALNKAGGSFTVEDGEDLYNISSNEALIRKASTVSSIFVTSNLGATQKTIRWIQANRLLTNP